MQEKVAYWAGWLKQSRGLSTSYVATVQGNGQPAGEP